MMKQSKGLRIHRLSELKKTSSSAMNPAKDKHQVPTNRWKIYARVVIDSDVWPTIVQLKRKP